MDSNKQFPVRMNRSPGETVASPATARPRRAVLGSFVGAVVDWYDFLLYLTTAELIFSTQFFPTADPRTGTLAAFAASGVGFLFRPLGGMVFGHFGDRLGRKKMLVMTVLLMGIATTLIGLLPTYKEIGLLAPIGLVFLRIMQGFAVGGEWGGAALIAVENGRKGHEALDSCGVQVGFGVGLLLANGLVMLTATALGNDAFLSWGWRIPFLISIALVLAALWIRRSMDESGDFEKEVLKKGGAEKGFPLWKALRSNPAGFFRIIALRIPENIIMYTITGFTLAYATRNLGMPRGTFLMINLLVGAVSCATIPLFAHLSDLFGRKRVYMAGALIGLLLSPHFFTALEARSAAGIIIFSLLLANIAHDMIVAVQQPLFAKFFGTGFRYSGVGFGYQVGAAVWGGFTPFFATALLGIDGSSRPVMYYLAAGCLIALIVAFFIGRDD